MFDRPYPDHLERSAPWQGMMPFRQTPPWHPIGDVRDNNIFAKKQTNLMALIYSCAQCRLMIILEIFQTSSQCDEMVLLERRR